MGTKQAAVASALFAPDSDDDEDDEPELAPVGVAEARPSHLAALPRRLNIAQSADASSSSVQPASSSSSSRAPLPTIRFSVGGGHGGQAAIAAPTARRSTSQPQHQAAAYGDRGASSRAPAPPPGVGVDPPGRPRPAAHHHLSNPGAAAAANASASSGGGGGGPGASATASGGAPSSSSSGGEPRADLSSLLKDVCNLLGPEQRSRFRRFVQELKAQRDAGRIDSLTKALLRQGPSVVGAGVWQAAIKNTHRRHHALAVRDHRAASGAGATTTSTMASGVRVVSGAHAASAPTAAAVEAAPREAAAAPAALASSTTTTPAPARTTHQSARDRQLQQLDEQRAQRERLAEAHRQRELQQEMERRRLAAQRDQRSVLDAARGHFATAFQRSAFSPTHRGGGAARPAPAAVVNLVDDGTTGDDNHGVGGSSASGRGVAPTLPAAAVPQISPPPPPATAVGVVSSSGVDPAPTSHQPVRSVHHAGVVAAAPQQRKTRRSYAEFLDADAAWRRLRSATDGARGARFGALGGRPISSASIEVEGRREDAARSASCVVLSRAAWLFAREALEALVVCSKRRQHDEARRLSAPAHAKATAIAVRWPRLAPGADPGLRRHALRCEFRDAQVDAVLDRDVLRSDAAARQQHKAAAAASTPSNGATTPVSSPQHNNNNNGHSVVVGAQQPAGDEDEEAAEDRRLHTWAEAARAARKRELRDLYGEDPARGIAAARAHLETSVKRVKQEHLRLQETDETAATKDRHGDEAVGEVDDGDDGGNAPFEATPFEPVITKQDVVHYLDTSQRFASLLFF